MSANAERCQQPRSAAVERPGRSTFLGRRSGRQERRVHACVSEQKACESQFKHGASLERARFGGKCQWSPDAFQTALPRRAWPQHNGAVAEQSNYRVTWSELGVSARLFRIAHATWGLFNLLALARLWQAALARRRGRNVVASGALLLSEGAALLVGRGQCPFGPFQSSLGDPVPMFEWFLPPRPAKAAIPVLTVAAIGAFAGVLLRPPRPGQDRKVRRSANQALS